ncbi:uncharacterized protein TNCV_1539481 [Trichonephila clavipes]|nr:uncharacterized protein TNCV_1539481 [Trichonephila clavipes]
MDFTMQKNDNTVHKVDMTNLGLKTLNEVPCYCHHTLPTMWEALNTISLSISRTMCESDHLLAHGISNVRSYCKPPTTYRFLNRGNEIKVTGRIFSLGELLI